MKKLSLFMGVILIVGIVGSFLTFQTGMMTTPIDETHSFDASYEIKGLDITTNNSRINIYATDEDEIQVSMVGDTLRNTTVALETEVIDQQLKIVIKENQIGWVNMNFISTSVTLNVYLPENLLENLNVNSRNGAVFIEDANVNLLNVVGTNGSFQLNNINALETTLQNTNGGITVNNHEGALNAKSTNSRILLNGVTGDINARTTNGRIEFIGAIDQDIQLQTTNGSISMDLAREPEDATFILSTTNGSTRLFGESTPYKVLGNGTHDVNLTTTNGSIKVNK